MEFRTGCGRYRQNVADRANAEVGTMEGELRKVLVLPLGPTAVALSLRWFRRARGTGR